MPVDKTPIQRAQIKFYEQLAAVFVFNAVLAGYTIISANAAGTQINWTIVIVAALAQGALALGNVLEKYFSAKNEPLLSSLVEAGRQEMLSRVPPAALTPQDQALSAAVTAALQPTTVTTTTTNAYIPPKLMAVPDARGTIVPPAGVMLPPNVPPRG
jgi:hypothetical protein